MTKRTLWILALAAGISARSGPAAEPQRFGGAGADVLAVEVPVQVVRDGHPVRDLTAADFTVFEGRKKQQITGFEVIDLGAKPGAAETGAPPVAIVARRHFLLFFDLLNSEAKSLAKARDAAKTVVAKLHPSDLVGVATYAVKGPELTLGFTSDRGQVALAIDRLGAPQLFGRSGDPLNLSLETTPIKPTQMEPAHQGHVDKDATYYEEKREDADRNQITDRAVQRQRLTAYTRALADFGKLMASVSGRKYVVLLSEGFDNSLLVGTVKNEDLTEINKAVEKGELWKVDNDARFGSSQSSNDLERMLEVFRRGDCVIQAVDIGGVRSLDRDQTSEAAYQRPGGQDGLFAMAQGTGGELYRNFNDLSAAMGKMLERTSVTYVLSFQPEVPRDGAYHPIKVELAKGGRGMKVVHRPGYFAPRPFDPREAPAHLLDAAETILGGREGGSLATALVAAPFPGAADRAYVPIVVEVDGASLLAGAETGPLPTEIYAYALRADGSIGDFFGQTLAFDLAKVKDKLQASGLKYYGHLELPPGDWSLRVLVRNGRTGDSSLRVAPLAVPLFAPGTPALLPPFFLEAPSGWLMVRETPRGDQRDEPYPFVAQKQTYVPASLPLLATDQKVSLSLVAYNLAGGDVRAEALVQGKDGQEIPGGEIRLLDREPQANAREVLVASFTPSHLPPGEYRLSVRLVGAGGASPLTSASVPFAVE
ncbi:MAG TPA: VWA domain-containing protein [Thermoanaerobaculia bacterium]|nr:VWA domain-containing protein [Thermoanaerobaculia bacterium]